MESVLRAIILERLERLLEKPASSRLDGKGAQLVYPLAYAYAADAAENALSGSPRVRECIDDLAGWIFEQKAPGRRMPYAVIKAFGLLRPTLGAAEGRWKQAIVDMIRSITLPALRECERLTVLSSSNVGYGTNHLIYEVACLAAYVAAFRGDDDFEGLQAGGPELVRYAEERLQQVMDYMHPDGYWAESDGPATSYNMLSTHCAYMAARDLECLERHRGRLERAAHFTEVTMLPNFDLMPVTNGRSQFRRGSKRLGYLGLLPTTRSLRRALLSHPEQGIGPRLDVQGLVYLTDSLVVVEGQPTDEAPSAWQEGDRTETLSDDFAIIRRKGWIGAVSNLDFRPRPEGHWNLDYTGLLTLYHDAFGTILYGANSKNDPAASAFRKCFTSFDAEPLPPERSMWQWIPGKGRFEVDEKGVRLMRDYRGFEGYLDFKALSTRKAVLAIAVNARRSEYPIEAVLMPAVRFGGAFKDGNGVLHTLSEEALVLDGRAVGCEITLSPASQPNLLRQVRPEALTIRFPENSVLRWPHAMWDCYNREADWQEDVKKKVALLEVPVGPEGAEIEFTIGHGS